MNLQEVKKMLDQYLDIEDGDEGPVPNWVMRAYTRVEHLNLLDRADRTEMHEVLGDCLEYLSVREVSEMTNYRLRLQTRGIR